MMRVSETDCPHPKSARRHYTETISGQTVRVEACGQCGRELVHPGDAQTFLATRGTTKRVSFTARELLLTLLGSNPRRPILGRTSLMKMAFLFEKDLAGSMQVGVDTLGFYPHHYGPYSKVVDDALRELESEGEVQISTEADFDRQKIELKSDGLRDSAQVLKRLTRDEAEVFAKRRKAWDQLGPKGLLQKVYEEYPAYSVKSKISDEVKRDHRWK